MAGLGAGKKSIGPGWVGSGESNRRGGRSLGLSTGWGRRAEPGTDSGVGLARLLFFLSGGASWEELGGL